MKYCNKTKAREYAKKMERINEFCINNGISTSQNLDSYYFTVNNSKYRVSNHTLAASDKGMRDSLTGEKLRDSYHEHDNDLICITAGKTRIIEIYNNLKAGYELTKRGIKK